MTLDELGKKSILILGFGTEGQATYEFLRKRWPEKLISIADQQSIGSFSEELAHRIQNDPAARLNFGSRYLDSLDPYQCEIIIKTPGIPASIDAIVRARQAGCTLTSHSQIFLSNYPRNKVIGVTGTKGKSTTASLIHHILRHAGMPAELVGNIGYPPLMSVDTATEGTYFVHEFSSHQLAEIEISPHIAVLLNIVPEHLDYYASFEAYVAAKENITRFQTNEDFLVFNADYPIPAGMANRTRAALRPFSARDRVSPGCYVRGETIVLSRPDGEEEIMGTGEIALAGRFNVQNVVAAITAAALCGVTPSAIRETVQTFQALPHRLERMGTFKGIVFYDDSIATVPDATLAALGALGSNVQTLILGGHERNLDFSGLGEQLPSNIRTVILFPATGERIWKAIESHSKNSALPEAFFVSDMEQAVKIAYERTAPGGICLLSPASPSFGMFKDYKERGDSFKALVTKLSSS
ncbi:MAG TPA: UDP-N-acetylmuramoyl-L-alanine--D-glutamate ligase [Terriglobia bacterium]|nr:UDP-N-acetylmuramoyl-L-alanine--D-glutamate ligase [Terriglobia bacterium]